MSQCGCPTDQVPIERGNSLLMNVVFHCCCLLKKPEMYCYSIIVDEDIVTWLVRWDGGRWRAKSVDIGMACAHKPPHITLICFLYIFCILIVCLFSSIILYLGSSAKVMFAITIMPKELS